MLSQNSMTKKIILVSIFILLIHNVFAQDQIETELDSITTESEAHRFIELYKSVNGKLITFNKEKHHSKIADDLFELGKGGKKVYKSEYDKTIYKLIDRNEVLHHRVSYIFFDSNKKPLQEINAIRNDIISKFNRGIAFEELAKQYSMDINGKRGGDSGWFAKGEMIPKFEEQVISNTHNKGSIFKIDVPSKKWYYVVLKTYDKKMIDEIKVLKIVEPITR